MTGPGLLALVLLGAIPCAGAELATSALVTPADGTALECGGDPVHQVTRVEFR